MIENLRREELANFVSQLAFMSDKDLGMLSTKEYELAQEFYLNLTNSDEQDGLDDFEILRAVIAAYVSYQQNKFLESMEIDEELNKWKKVGGSDESGI